MSRRLLFSLPSGRLICSWDDVLDPAAADAVWCGVSTLARSGCSVNFNVVRDVDPSHSNWLCVTWRAAAFSVLNAKIGHGTVQAHL